MKIKNLTSLLVPALFLLIAAVWQVLFYFIENLEQSIPRPTQVFISIYELTLDGTLIRYIAASLFRVTVGFYIAFILAFPAGLLLGQWKLGNRVFNGLIQFLRPISPLAWIPLAMIWFGIGDKPAVFLIFISCFFPLLISIIAAVMKINPRYFQVGANFNFTYYEKMKYILIPAIIPDIITAVRVSVGVGWLVVVAAEMIAVKSGLGYLIIDARNALRMDQVVASMIVIGFIGMILDRLIVKMEESKSLEWKFGRK